jgi:hypothetical protein
MLKLFGLTGLRCLHYIDHVLIGILTSNAPTSLPEQPYHPGPASPGSRIEALSPSRSKLLLCTRYATTDVPCPIASNVSRTVEVL